MGGGLRALPQRAGSSLVLINIFAKDLKAGINKCQENVESHQLEISTHHQQACSTRQRQEHGTTGNNLDQGSVGR